MSSASVAPAALRAGRRGPAGGSSWWALGSAVVAVLLMGLAWVDPTYPLIGAVGLVLLGIAVFFPRVLVLLSLTAVVLSVPIEIFVNPIGGFVDEGASGLCAVALTLRRLVTHGRLVWLPGLGWFGSYLLIGGLSAWAAHVPIGIMGPAAFTAVKGILLAHGVAQLPWTDRDLRRGTQWGVAFVVLIAVTGLVNLFAPGAWAQVTTGRAPTFVGPIPALNGIFQRPAGFSRICGVLAIAALVYALAVRRSAAALVMFVVSAGLAVLTLQVKSVVGLIATVTVVALRFLRPVGVVVLVCFVPLVLVIAVPVLISFVGGDVKLYLLQVSARSLLIDGGVKVANAFFPLGAGFGRYGSATAATHYSPLYYQLGFSHRYGLAPGAHSGQFLNDTQWPAIYGETGWFGTAFFAMGLLCMLVSLVRPSRRDTRMLRWMRFTGLGWMVLLLVESIAAPVFVSSPSFPFVFVGAGVVASLRSRRRDAKRRRPPQQRVAHELQPIVPD